MLFILGSVLAGIILFGALREDPPQSACEHMTTSDTSFKVKEEVGILKLPSCNLIAVQLGPSARGQG